MHGIEQRAGQPIDVFDDRPADDGGRDIQVILIESATIQLNDTNSTKRYWTLSDRYYVQDIRDTVESADSMHEQAVA